MITVIGIDPGKHGAIAWRRGDRTGVAKFSGMTDLDTLGLLRAVVGGADSYHAYLELVHAMPKNGSKSAFSLGQHYGALRMALIAAGIPFETVTPAAWQKAMKCRSGGDKNVTKARAQELYPALKVTHDTADALLIATYGWERWAERAAT